MATGAADGLFWSIYEGCISGGDTSIERRPYHRNCGCALHNRSRGNCPHALPKCKNVSYPMRRSWSEGNLVLSSYCHTSPLSSPSPSPSPVVRCANRPQVPIYKEKAAAERSE